MKRYLALILIACFIFAGFQSGDAATAKFIPATSLTGGAVDALDGINGSSLNDGDAAIVINSTNVYHYTLDADSALDESAPYIISPDTNAGDKRWILTGIGGANGVYEVDASETDQGATGNHRTIKAYVDAIGSSKIATIKLRHTGAGNATTYTLTTSETTPSNITFVIEPGAILDGAGTLTINGPFPHGDDLTQKFGSSINISFGVGSIKEDYPHWWINDGAGTAGDPWTSDSGTAGVQEAVDSMGAYGRTFCPEGYYAISANIGLPTGYTLIGAGKISTRFVLANITAISSNDTSSRVDYFKVKGIYFQGNYPTNVGQMGISLVRACRVIIEDCTFYKCRWGINMDAKQSAANAGCYYNSILACKFAENYSGIEMRDGTNNNLIGQMCRFHGNLFGIRIGMASNVDVFNVIQNSSFEGNISDAFGPAGVGNSIVLKEYSRNTVIKNSYFESNDRNIEFESGCAGTLLDGNIINQHGDPNFTAIAYDKQHVLINNRDYYTGLPIENILRGDFKIANEVYEHRTSILTATTEKTALNGATVTWTNAIPAGSMVIGVSARVTTLVEGATNIDIGDGTDADIFIDGMGVAANTTADLTNCNDGTLLPKVYKSATNIVLTAIGGAANFSAGDIRMVLHYVDLVAPTS